ncbi:hypothetical protein [Streptomyces sp. PSAA01]|uniref:hypothetical protein n=1 Tax=Streptomyces sp. PSAA01 TaxID=2912762 RepID=UPI001F3E2C29|nr:hypothetical protein [Streptomyces sp. PSAA01]MCG0284228.1 hypothetical protein [Streptomyces sp. PSAA01]
MVGLGQEAVWWRRFDYGGQVLVRQDNIVLNLNMYGTDPAVGARLPAYAEEVLHRALTKARRSS